jgi:hypothetical protein
MVRDWCGDVTDSEKLIFQLGVRMLVLLGQGPKKQKELPELSRNMYICDSSWSCA